MSETLRVAFFPDTYSEVNGAAMTCRKLAGYARERGYPFLCVRAGEKSETTQDGNYTDMVLKRCWASFDLDEGLKYDPFFNRYVGRVRRELEKFRPDVIHITGVNDVSIIGAWLAYKFQIPLVGSWHTNVHEFAASRLQRMLGFLPSKMANGISKFAEHKIMQGAILYYKQPKVLLVPNEELIKILEKGTGRTAQLMSRGVDSELLSPSKRTVNDGIFRLGFVGRLRAEKNVRMLTEIEEKLFAAGKTNFKFLIVGEGSEREWLEKNVKTAEFTGFISGEELARAYANMDVFLFPSETDAFGNVVQEANSSGVPSIVSNLGGPKFLVKPGITGYVAETADDFARYAIEIMDNPDKLPGMRKAARESAVSRSWDSVFDKVYESYQEALRIQAERHGDVKNLLPNQL